MAKKKMKAAVVRAFGQPLQIDEVDVPEMPPGQVLVKVAASGVCHTDLHAADGDWPVKPSLPFIPGHEGAGHVTQVGAGVRRIREGDRVGVPWLHTACGYCEHCITGWETLCGSCPYICVEELRRERKRGKLLETFSTQMTSPAREARSFPHGRECRLCAG